MVPTRQCSTVYRRSIRAASSRGMSYAVPGNAAPAQHTQAHMRQQRVGAASAHRWQIRARRRRQRGVWCRLGEAVASQALGACRMRAVKHRERMQQPWCVTLSMSAPAPAALRTLPFAPARAARSMLEPTGLALW